MMSWLMRIGFFMTSPIVGLIAHHGGLRFAMVVPLVVGIVAATFTHRLASPGSAP